MTQGQDAGTPGGKTTLVYVGSGDVPGLRDLDMTVVSVDRPGEIVRMGLRPDIILLDPEPDGTLDCLEAIRSQNFTFRPGLFCAVEASCPADVRFSLLEAGFDEVVEKPLSPKELYLRSRIYAERVSLIQKKQVDRQALERSFGYLDRFKAELGAAKAELIEEKNSLNTALKQIQKMTGERSRIKQELSDLRDTLKKNMEGFGQILTALIQARVEYNRGHGNQVARIAGFLGREMGLSENQLEDLRKAAMLHEIGLLFMSAGFTADEEQRENPGSAYDRAMMRQYAVKGADLLNNCPGFEKVALIIRSLNEWADGTGYPDGLKKRYIPLGSRILAGADELEKLRENPGTQGPEALLAGLEEMAGVRLDPMVVELLGKYVVTCLTPESFRVRGVGIDQLEPGMTLGMALFTTTGTKLFSANTQLTRDAIDKIVQYSREYPVNEIVYVKV